MQLPRAAWAFSPMWLVSLLKGEVWHQRWHRKRARWRWKQRWGDVSTCQGMPKMASQPPGMGQSLPYSPWKEPTLGTPWSCTSSFQNCLSTWFCYLRDGFKKKLAKFSDNAAFCHVLLWGLCSLFSRLWTAGCSWVISFHLVSAEFTPLDTVCSGLQGVEILSVQMTKDLHRPPLLSSDIRSTFYAQSNVGSVKGQETSSWLYQLGHLFVAE